MLEKEVSIMCWTLDGLLQHSVLFVLETRLLDSSVP